MNSHASLVSPSIAAQSRSPHSHVCPFLGSPHLEQNSACFGGLRPDVSVLHTHTHTNTQTHTHTHNSRSSCVCVHTCVCVMEQDSGIDTERVDIPHVPFRGAARRPEKEQTSPQRSPPPHARTSSLHPPASLFFPCSRRQAPPRRRAGTSARNRAPGSAQSFAKACGAAVLDGIPGLSRLCAVSGYSARLPTRSVYKLRRLTQPGTLSCTGPRCFVLPIRRRRLSRRGRSHTKISCHLIPTRIRQRMRRWPRAHCL
jgi:hypothetical protein